MFLFPVTLELPKKDTHFFLQLLAYPRVLKNDLYVGVKQLEEEIFWGKVVT